MATRIRIEFSVAAISMRRAWQWESVAMGERGNSSFYIRIEGGLYLGILLVERI